MNRSPQRDLIVGLFVLAGLAALAYLSMTVGGLTFRNTGGLTIYASFDEIGGLKPRAPVVIAGVKVGQVVDIVLDSDYRARVRMDLRHDLKLPVDTTASIVTAGLLGDQYIALQVGGEDRYLTNGGTITMTESAISLERLIGKFIYSVDRGGSEKSSGGGTHE
ncbi:MAG: outer membrane lipid asymmetry maintenance protein MlaD [Candidatus Binatia bacterium]|nr:MAG: outer membrane lipid asymmetry maintenance protein MlaD [Candidatus Binatia bacterium]